MTRTQPFSSGASSKWKIAAPTRCSLCGKNGWSWCGGNGEPFSGGLTNSLVWWSWTFPGSPRTAAATEVKRSSSSSRLKAAE